MTQKVKRERPPGAGKRGPIPGEGGGPDRKFSEAEVQQLKGMASVGATKHEMAAVLGISEREMFRMIAETPVIAAALKAGEGNLRVSLRNKQVQIALDDKHPAQATMLIWAGKTVLGQSDRLNVKIDSVQDAMEALKAAGLTQEEALAELGGEADAADEPAIH